MSKFGEKFSGKTTHVQPVETREGEWCKYDSKAMQIFGACMQLFGGALIVGGLLSGTLTLLSLATVSTLYIVGTGTRSISRSLAEYTADVKNGRTPRASSLLKNAFKCALPLPSGATVRKVAHKLGWPDLGQLS